MSPYRFTDSWPRRNLLLLAYAVMALGMVLGFVRVQMVVNQTNHERAERSRQVNALACAIETDARGSLLVIHARAGRGLPGDDLLALNKTRLAIAASRLVPSCDPPR